MRPWKWHGEIHLNRLETSFITGVVCAVNKTAFNKCFRNVKSRGKLNFLILSAMCVRLPGSSPPSICLRAAGFENNN